MLHVYIAAFLNPSLDTTIFLQCINKASSRQPSLFLQDLFYKIVCKNQEDCLGEALP